MGQLFFLRFVNNSSVLLLRKVYVFDIFNTVDFSQIFGISQSTEILILHGEKFLVKFYWKFGKSQTQREFCIFYHHFMNKSINFILRYDILSNYFSFFN